MTKLKDEKIEYDGPYGGAPLTNLIKSLNPYALKILSSDWEDLMIVDHKLVLLTLERLDGQIEDIQAVISNIVDLMKTIADNHDKRIDKIEEVLLQYQLARREDPMTEKKFDEFMDKHGRRAPDDQADGTK